MNSGMNTLSYRILHILESGWRNRYVIIIPVLTLPVLGLLIGIFTPKHYTSHTSMLVQETAKMNPFLEDLSVSVVINDRIDALKTLLHSRHILGTVAEEQGLINAETSAKEHDQIIAEISDALTVQMVGKDLIRIDYKSHNPEGMKEMLTAVSKQFVEQLLAPELSSMKDSSHFLTEHLKYRQEALQQAEAALIAFKNQHATELPELHLSNISRLTQLKQRLSERQAEIAGAIQSLGGIDQQLSKTNPVLGRIEEQIIRIREELSINRTRYTDQHSSIQNSLTTLKRLEEERQYILTHTEQETDIGQLWSIASSTPINSNMNKQPLLVSQLENLQLTRSKVDGLSEEIKSLKQMVEKLEEQTSAYGENSSEFSRLERDLTIKRDLYDDLLLRYEKARITGSLGVFERDKRVKVIDRPFTPTTPINLPIYLFVISGLFGGILLGCSFSVILEFMDTSLRRRNRLEELTGVPVLSRIPFLPNPSISKTN